MVLINVMISYALQFILMVGVAAGAISLGVLASKKKKNAKEKKKQQA